MSITADIRNLIAFVETNHSNLNSWEIAFFVNIKKQFESTGHISIQNQEVLENLVKKIESTGVQNVKG